MSRSRPTTYLNRQRKYTQGAKGRKKQSSKMRAVGNARMECLAAQNDNGHIPDDLSPAEQAFFF